MTEQKEQAQFYWHIHHNILLEPLTEPIENRIEYIKTQKPKNERKLRLRLLKPVRGKLPDEVVKAGEILLKAWESWDKESWVKAMETWNKEACVKAREDYIKAREAYVKVGEKYKKEIEKLHKKECPNCPFDGKTIFSNKEKKIE